MHPLARIWEVGTKEKKTYVTGVFFFGGPLQFKKGASS